MTEHFLQGVWCRDARACMRMNVNVAAAAAAAAAASCMPSFISRRRRQITDLTHWTVSSPAHPHARCDERQVGYDEKQKRKVQVHATMYMTRFDVNVTHCAVLPYIIAPMALRNVSSFVVQLHAAENIMPASLRNSNKSARM